MGMNRYHRLGAELGAVGKWRQSPSRNPGGPHRAGVPGAQRQRSLAVLAETGEGWAEPAVRGQSGRPRNHVFIGSPAARGILHLDGCEIGECRSVGLKKHVSGRRVHVSVCAERLSHLPESQCV